ncbi:MAG: B12-binding domain-containing radical SAM protein [Candidatus Omnitrophica bacterium]|nr:B12-binding domain-containing radical SAM protein [Candidatus Omnitrophota bacterium]
MKVGFIYADFLKGGGGKFYHGIAYLSSVLKQSGHQTELFHIKENKDAVNLGSWLQRCKPSLLAFTATTNIYPYIKELAVSVKKDRDIPLIIGGIHATLVPEQVCAERLFDFVCVGEGEGPLAELCDALEKNQDVSSIRNIWVKTPAGYTKNSMRPLQEDLDTLPFPDREFMDYAHSYDLLRMRRGVFMASRGCSFDCSFCCNHALKKLYKDCPESYVRFRSVDNVITEIKEVAKRYPGIETIIFHDDCLLLKKKWFKQLLEIYAKDIALPFSMNARVELIDRETLASAKSAGLRVLSVGIEHGSENIRKKLLNRNMSNKQIIDAFETAHGLGIKTISYNIVGFPRERFSDMLETIKLNARVKTETIQISIFYPYPGTKLYDIVKEKGLIGAESLDSYFEGTILKFSPFKKRQIKFILNNFESLKITYQFLLKFPAIIHAPIFYGSLFSMWTLIFLRLENLVIALARPLARVFKSNVKKRRDRQFVNA